MALISERRRLTRSTDTTGIVALPSEDNGGMARVIDLSAVPFSSRLSSRLLPRLRAALLIKALESSMRVAPAPHRPRVFLARSGGRGQAPTGPASSDEILESSSSIS